METSSPWHNKITGYGMVDVDSILANERNYHIHSRAQQEALAAVLGNVGIIQNLIINQRTSALWPSGDQHVETLLDGACRVMVALRHGQQTLPVTFVDLTPEEEYMALATLDPITRLAGMDHVLYAALVHDIPPDTTHGTLLSFFSTMAQEHPQDAPKTPEAPRSTQGTCCPACGHWFLTGHQGQVSPDAQ